MVLRNSIFQHSQVVISFVLLTCSCSRSDLAPYEEGLPENIIPIQSSRVVEVDPRPASGSSDNTVAVAKATAAATTVASTGAVIGGRAVDSVETLGGVNPDSLDEFESPSESPLKGSSNLESRNWNTVVKEPGFDTPRVKSEPNVKEKKVADNFKQKERKKSQKNEIYKETPAKPSFQKPLNGKIISKFGELDADGFANEGINVAGSKGQKVVCFSNGKVVYTGSDKLPEYGNMVIVKHGDGLISTYAHLNEISVKKGQILKANDKIGTVGQTGDGIDTPQLYFQVMKNNKPIDPMKYF